MTGVSQNMKSNSSVVTGAPGMAAAAFPISTTVSLNWPRAASTWPKSGLAFETDVYHRCRDRLRTGKPDPEPRKCRSRAKRRAYSLSVRLRHAH